MHPSRRVAFASRAPAAMQRRRRIRAWLTAGLALVALQAFNVPSPLAEGIHDHDHPRVLVVHSYHQGLSWTDGLQQGFLAGLGEQAQHLNIYYEHLDTLRKPLSTPQAEAPLIRHLEERYAAARIDYLLATDDPAYQLLLAHREQIAPGKPLLFAGLNNYREEQLQGIDRVAGIAETPDFLATLALMQKLHPAARKVVVIGDGTRTFESNLAALEAANAALPRPYSIEILAGRLMEDILARAHGLPDDALLFLMSRPRDTRGNLITGPEVARILRDATRQPIYSAWDFYLGNGIVGGKLISSQEQGKALAGLLLRLLRGEPLDSLPRLTESPNRYGFDYAELQRFAISEKALPAGSLILNRPPHIWETHPALFFATLSILLLLLAAIAFLVRTMKIKREATATVERELHLLQALMNASPFPMYFKDTALIYRRVNDAFTGFLGKPREAVVGQPISAVAGEPFASVYRDRDNELLARGGHQIYESRVLAADGRAHDMIFHKAVVETADGQVAGIVGAMLDVTELRHAEAELRDLNQQLEQRVAARTTELAGSNAELQRAIDSLSLAQDELARRERLSSLVPMVAGVAHELNTPIGNSLTVATTLQEAADHLKAEIGNGAIRRSSLDGFVSRCTNAMDILTRNLQRAAQLIANFKEVAVDQTSDRRRSFALAGVVREIVDTFESGVRGNRPSIIVDIPDDIALDSYPGALGQILLNFLDNARIHAFSDGHRGEIRIAATPAANDRIHISVSDNGVGIAADHLPRIFDPFFTTRLGHGGSGLGLSIVYRLVTQTLGGRIRVSSQEGRGTMFVLEIPAVAPADADALAPSPAAAADGSGQPVPAASELPLHLRDDLLDIRELVEAKAAEVAATRATQADREQLQRIFDRLDASFGGDDLEAQIECDLAFHMAIIDATRDPALRKVGDAIIQLMYGHIRKNLSGLTPNHKRRATLREQHRTLFEAIMRHDPAAAASAAGDHMAYVRAEGKLPLAGQEAAKCP